jgi:hypothetical protein
MTRVILDAILRSKLHDLAKPLELCDETGRILGWLVPVPDANGLEPREPQVSEEELDRREQAGEKRYTTAEMLAHLGAL